MEKGAHTHKVGLKGEAAQEEGSRRVRSRFTHSEESVWAYAAVCTTTTTERERESLYTPVIKLINPKAKQSMEGFSFYPPVLFLFTLFAYSPAAQRIKRARYCSVQVTARIMYTTTTRCAHQIHSVYISTA